MQCGRLLRCSALCHVLSGTVMHTPPLVRHAKCITNPPPIQGRLEYLTHVWTTAAIYAVYEVLRRQYLAASTRVILEQRPAILRTHSVYMSHLAAANNSPDSAVTTVLQFGEANVHELQPVAIVDAKLTDGLVGEYGNSATSCHCSFQQEPRASSSVWYRHVSQGYGFQSQNEA